MTTVAGAPATCGQTDMARSVLSDHSHIVELTLGQRSLVSALCCN